jgi:hypothetical protein
MSLGYLTLFTSSGGLCRCSRFSAARCFNPFGSSGACCLLCMTEILLQGSLGGCAMLGSCGICCFACR